ncbi:transketolase [Thermodesulfobacteriota bacterium]
MTRDKNELEKIAGELRIDILKMLHKSQSGHTGGSLSSIDIMTCLYFSEMNISAAKQKDPDRDRFVLSKGHCAPALYAVLAKLGFFDKSELDSLRQVGAILQGHPDMNLTPGVEMSTGSLGQGLSAANGMAMALKLDNSPARVYVVMGDGEQQEGQIWEAAMTASHYKLDNLLAFVDLNGLQIDGNVADIMGISPISDKWRAFGWNVIEIDGHNMDEIQSACYQARKTLDKPTVVIAKTLKGKGFAFCEGKVGYHGKAPTKDDMASVGL